jgi:hypothetical protein
VASGSMVLGLPAHSLGLFSMELFGNKPGAGSVVLPPQLCLFRQGSMASVFVPVHLSLSPHGLPCRGLGPILTP